MFFGNIFADGESWVRVAGSQGTILPALIAWPGKGGRDKTGNWPVDRVHGALLDARSVVWRRKLCFMSSLSEAFLQV